MRSGQINPTVGDFSGNAAKIIEFSRRAQADGAGLILFPELSVCGYPPRDLVERPSFVARNRETVEQIAAETRGIAVICGLVTPAHSETGKSVMNSAALLQDGKIAFMQSKMLLPTYDVFDEMRNFAPAKSQELFSFCGNRMALTICEDAWNDKLFWPKRLYTVDPVESLIRAGGNFVLNISVVALLDRQARTAPRHAGQPSRASTRFRSRWSIRSAATTAWSSTAPAWCSIAEGEVIAQGRSFEEDLIYFDSQDAHRRYARTDRKARKPASMPRWCWARATTCTSADFSKAIIGLSGGIDSALTAVIAADAVGPENVIGVGMPGPYSSPGSIDDARALAKNLGIRFELLSINRGLRGVSARRCKNVFRRTERRRDRRKHSVARPRHAADGALE